MRVKSIVTVIRKHAESVIFTSLYLCLASSLSRMIVDAAATDDVDHHAPPEQSSGTVEDAL
jgi:hypothetical protein